MKRNSIFDLLRTQSNAVIDKIYDGAFGAVATSGSDSQESSGPVKRQSTWATKAVFQSLSPLAKSFVMKLLFVEKSFVVSEFLEWSASQSSLGKEAREAMEDLISLRIIVPYKLGDVQNGTTPTTSTSMVSSTDHVTVKQTETSDSGVLQHIMNPHFQKSFRLALLCPVEPWSEHTETNNSVEPSAPPQMSLDELDKHCFEKWSEVLGFIVGLVPANALSSNVVEVFVKRCGLMVESVNNRGRKSLTITAKGYEFMLKDYLSQVWDFVLNMMKHSQNQQENLSLLFMLPYCTFGRGYSIEALSKAQQQLVFEFSQVGIVYMESITSRWFFPSRVAINMIFGSIEVKRSGIPRPLDGVTGARQPSDVSSLEFRGNTQPLRIIVETNNQVVAYLSNNIHLAMLQLFVDVSVRMPNMALGRITKEKIREAFRMGIKASQIVDFLILHAHPLTIDRVPVVPENVTDQLALWEAEGSRIVAQQAVVIDFKEFMDIRVSMFASLIEELRKNNVLLWHSSNESSMVAVAPDGIKIVSKFIAENKK